MKRIISGSIVIILGLLIAFGPQFLFKLCAHGNDGFPRCHWSGQAEIGIGLLIAALVGSIINMMLINREMKASSLAPLPSA